MLEKIQEVAEWDGNDLAHENLFLKSLWNHVPTQSYRGKRGENWIIHCHEI